MARRRSIRIHTHRVGGNAYWTFLANRMVVADGRLFEVRNGGAGSRPCHLIPYVGSKAGFTGIFDELVPDRVGGRRIIDVFGGSGSFAIYCCRRFGSRRVTYNDNNPVLANFMVQVRDNPGRLASEYGRHKHKHSTDYYLETRRRPLDRGMAGAGRFLYLAKNAFSGKIRFNRSNVFNSPARKRTGCPALDISKMHDISSAISNMQITRRGFEEYGRTRGAFMYLDPPYMNNTNQHYNGVPSTAAFAGFVRRIAPRNMVMISEQNEPGVIGLPGSFMVHRVRLLRSLQYATRTGSKEIIATNYRS